MSPEQIIELRRLIGTRYDCYNHIFDALKQYILDHPSTVMGSKIQKK